MKKLLLLLVAMVIITIASAQTIRVYFKFDSVKNDQAVRSEIRQLYLANPFHSFRVDPQLNWERYSGYITSVKNNIHLSLVAKNPITGQKEPFDDTEALYYLAKAYVPWGMKWFQRADLACSEYNNTRSWRISYRWAHSWKYWKRNKMFVPNHMVTFE